MRWQVREDPPDWWGQAVEAVSRRRTDCLSPIWWRRIRVELAVTVWTGWALLVACGLAGITFLLSATLYQEEQNHRIDQIVQEALEIRRDLVSILCRTSPSECPTDGPGEGRYEANAGIVSPGSEGR